MKRVIFLAGLPAVGKSTIARSLASKFNGSVLDIDRIKRELVDPDTVSTSIDPPEVRWKCYEQAAKEVLSSLEAGELTVVVDEVFHIHELREKIEYLFLEKKVKVDWIEVICSHQEVAKRLNAVGRAGHILSTKQSLDMNLLFQDIFEPFPDGKLNHLVFKNENGSSVDDLPLKF